VQTFGRIGNDAEIKAGIGANDVGAFLRLGKSVVVSDGWPVSGDFLSLGDNTSVFDVFANHLSKGSGVVIRGTTGTPVLPLTAPFCPIPTITCGSTPVTLQPGESRTLAPGAYGSLAMPNGTSLTLTGGTYSFCSIRTGRNVTINVQGAGNSTINVLGDVRFENGSFFGPTGSTLTPILNVAGNVLRIGAGTTVRAFISAPDAVLSMGRGAHVIGTFCVERTRSDKHIILECPPDTIIPSAEGAFLD
jgi:hypothetical protein